MGTRQLYSIAGLLLVLTTGLTAQGGAQIRREVGPSDEREIARSAVNFAGSWRPPGQTGFTRVVGTVIDIRQIPVANATVQLRNLDTGNIEQVEESNAQGSYEFMVEDSGTYVVEMVMVDGVVLALSNAGSLGRYETLQTVVQLPGRWDMGSRSMVATQSATSFFGMSAQTSMTGATIETAIDSNISPTDAGVPVSAS